MHYAYLYIDPIRDEPIYAGKGKNLRCLHHLSRKDKHPLPHRIGWIRAQGQEPVIHLFPCESSELAYLVEAELVNKYGRKDLGKGPLLNLTDGGEFHDAPSAETRAKISQNLKGKKSKFLGIPRDPAVIQRIKDAKVGVVFSAEHKRNIGLAKKGISVNKGRKFTDEQKRNLSNLMKSRCTVDGIQFFNSVQELKAELGQGLKGTRSPTFRLVPYK